MQEIDRQYLWEVIDISDMAIRVASQLRRVMFGNPPTDSEALEAAIEFLERARNGGVFVAEQSSQMQVDSFKSLNWATDTFLLRTPPDAGQELDYEQVVNYLNRLHSVLERIPKGAGNIEDVELTDCINFFELMGDFLGGKADQAMRHECVNTSMM